MMSGKRQVPVPEVYEFQIISLCLYNHLKKHS